MENKITIKTCLDNEKNIIKEDSIENKPNEYLAFYRTYYYPTFIENGGTLNIIFKTNDFPEEHTMLHDRIIKRIKQSKELHKRIEIEITSKSGLKSWWGFDWIETKPSEEIECKIT